MKTNRLLNSKTLATGLAAALIFALADVRAVTVTGPNVTTTPGSAFDVAFDFDFGADTSISSFELDLTFDPTRVTFAGLTSARYQGISYTPPAVAAALTGAGMYSQTTDSSGLHATWFALDSSFHALPALHLSGQAELIYSFTVGAGATPGTSTDVGILLTYSDEALNPVGPLGHTVTINVTAVPEPGTWVLLAAGIGVIGAFTRRGKAG